MQRATSFVNKIEFEIHGNVMKDAVQLGDVDNDERNELAVGTVYGDLFIFKECFNIKPWIAANGLGMITSIVVGDITNSKKNSLVVVSGEGFCHIFDVFLNKYEENDKKMHLKHMQQLPSSAKMVLLADIDGDGNLELVIGLTDRVVRSYRWTHLPSNSEGSCGDTLVALNKWELANQIGSVSLHTKPNGKSCLLVAQPGAMYVQLDCDTSVVEKSCQTKELMTEMPLEYQSVLSSKLRANSNMTTEVLGDVQCISGKSHFAVATLDGVLMLVDCATGDPVWCLTLDHQLFSLSKLDVTNDGREEVVVSSWDGHTYIVDYEKNVLLFHLDDSISSFRAGKFSASFESGNAPCLVFATLSNRVVVYYDIRVPRIPLTTLTNEMSSHENTISQLGIDVNDEKAVQKLYSFCLYGKN